ncbi:hypothetical protein SUGI_0457980 [Cryptomeria japonica]|nr:hypothetical protein SUGI_0457980 [Cryptomeria japonica]
MKKYWFLKAIVFFPLVALSSINAYDPLDPTANITITWDLLRWTPDGYIASVTMQNYQLYRQIEFPGWSLEWTWARDEVIWSMRGAKATEEGDCSNFKTDPIPHSCSNHPNIVDMLPGVNDGNQAYKNCCKGGVLAAWAQDPLNSISSFEIKVGRTGNTVNTINLPTDFGLNGPGTGYSCSSAERVKPTVFPDTVDGRRTTQALETWQVTCIYSQFLASRDPACCVSLSAFYDDEIIPCNTCSCNCNKDQNPDQKNCIQEKYQLDEDHLIHPNASILHCTNHMCPVRIHWHVQTSYLDYWRVMITATNFDYMKNYSNWNIVIQHPNFKSLNRVFSFNNKTLQSPDDDTLMLWGKQNYNELLIQAQQEGFGVVQTELLLAKDKPNFSFRNGYAFPHRVYFNGDSCILPPPDLYPRLPDKKISVI